MNLSPVDDDLAADAAPFYGDPDLDALAAIERRVLWLSTLIIQHANRGPPEHVRD